MLSLRDPGQSVSDAERTHSSYPHWDAHDIFVIQLAGSKRWLVHESRLDRPLPSYRFDPNRHEVGPQTGEFVVNAGDIAYVPRGLVHHPLATDYSVHIALGVLVRTWADVLSEMLPSIASRHGALREALPVHYGEGGFDIAACLAAMPDFARIFGDPCELVSALKGISNDVAGGRSSNTRGLLSQFARDDEATLDTVVNLPRRSAAVLERRDDSCRVRFNNVELSVADTLYPALAYIRDHGEVRVGDIPAASDAHRLALAQKLLDEGCLAMRS